MLLLFFSMFFMLSNSHNVCQAKVYFLLKRNIFKLFVPTILLLEF